ncbi:hypothetical protein BDZ45DRAFT_312341 [Acephala macrosclerotiorum]|nr:hypothetical protein BDZ45DRAFT_312341 [Acephala macrosclerotiorum]
MVEPFITLCPSDNSDSSASESYDDNTPLSTPPLTTHDTSRAEFHVRDLEAFAQDLQNAANRAFPNSSLAKPRYASVSVLLLRWEDDEMNVDWELDDLEKIFRQYGFDTESWLIPRKNAHLKLMSKAVEIVENHDGKDDLVIVYYAGHAFINTARQATWCCKSDPSYASLEWSAIQTLFEKAHFDVLLLLDCCAAASAAPRVGSAVTETIAACGFESIAPQPGRFSFTNSLIEVLEDWIDSPSFSAAMLHNRVLSVLKHEQPERTQNGKRRKMECRRTPIHIMAAADPTLPSIELGRRIRPRSQSPISPKLPDTKETPTTTGQTDAKTPHTDSINVDHAHTQDPLPTNTENIKQDQPQAQLHSSKRKTYTPDSIYEVTEGDYDIPRVIISLALEKHQTLNSEYCAKWLTSCPPLVKYAKVEAVYKSFSVLVLLSMPVFLWDLLPNNPACSFVGYITSTNLNHLWGHQILSCMTSTAENCQNQTTRPRIDRAEVEVLEAIFQKFDGKPNTPVKRTLAQGFGIDLSRINNWFQNRRAKLKQEKKRLAYEAGLRAESSSTFGHSEAAVHSDLGGDDGYWSAGELTAMRLDEIPCEDTEDDDGYADLPSGKLYDIKERAKSLIGKGNGSLGQVVPMNLPRVLSSEFDMAERANENDELQSESNDDSNSKKDVSDERAHLIDYPLSTQKKRKRSVSPPLLQTSPCYEVGETEMWHPTDPRSIYAHGLSHGTTVESLARLIASTGGKTLSCRIVSAELFIIAEIVVETRHQADYAIKILDGKEVDGHVLRLSHDLVMAHHARMDKPFDAATPRATLQSSKRIRLDPHTKLPSIFMPKPEASSASRNNRSDNMTASRDLPQEALIQGTSQYSDDVDHTQNSLSRGLAVPRATSELQQVELSPSPVHNLTIDNLLEFQNALPDNGSPAPDVHVAFGRTSRSKASSGLVESSSTDSYRDSLGLNQNYILTTPFDSRNLSPFNYSHALNNSASPAHTPGESGSEYSDYQPSEFPEFEDPSFGINIDAGVPRADFTPQASILVNVAYPAVNLNRPLPELPLQASPIQLTPQHSGLINTMAEPTPTTLAEIVRINPVQLPSPTSSEQDEEDEQDGAVVPGSHGDCL